MSSKARVVVYVQDGCVDEVIADQALELLVVDFDTEGADEKDLVRREEAVAASMMLFDFSPDAEDIKGVKSEFDDYEKDVAEDLREDFTPSADLLSDGELMVPADDQDMDSPRLKVQGNDA